MHCFKRLIKISLILLLTVGVVFSCCSCGIESSATTIATTFANTFFLEEDYGILTGYEYKNDGNSEVLKQALLSENNTADCMVIKAYSDFLDTTYSSDVITRADWLKMLLTQLDYEIQSGYENGQPLYDDQEFFNDSEYVITAIKNKIIGSGGSSVLNPYCAATRQYVSTSLVNAVGYPKTYKLKCSDYKMIEDKKQVACCVYLGYFDLDSNNCFNPYDTVTKEQVDYIIEEVAKIELLKGKSVMSFGDSIMHGDGNNFEGIADLLSHRYMMTATDYSKGGSTFGKVHNREQISNQISIAVNENAYADIILINGGTNDMRKIAPGSISSDYDYENYGNQYFCSGMEYALGLLKDNYADTPVVYIRAHNMEYGIERNELHFGNLALSICDKWEIAVVDIFNDTDFNTHDRDMKSTYTVATRKCKNGDSIHPNRLGYYEFYIPLVSQKIVSVMSAGE